MHHLLVPSVGLVRGCCYIRRTAFSYALILPNMGRMCIELNRYMHNFYSILVKISSGVYNERVNETPL